MTMIRFVPGVARAVDSLVEAISGVVAEAKAKAALVDLKVEVFNKVKEQLGTAEKAREEVAAMWQNAAFQELTGLDKLIALQKRQQDAIKRSRIKTAGTNESVIRDLRKRADRLSAELQKAKSAYIAAQQEQISVNKAVADMKEEIRKSVESMPVFRIHHLIILVINDGSRIETGNRFFKNVKEYNDAMREGNTKLAEESVKILTKNYDELYSQAKKKTEENRKTMENLQKMQMDAMLMTADTDAAKYAIYQQEQQRRQQEAMTKMASGDLKEAVQAWQKASQAAQQMISIQNKLAQAEMNANESTRKMILQMDKFKSSAVETVDAFSGKAVELQSRRFDTLPTMTNSTTMQNTANQLNQQLAQQTQQFIQQMQNRIQADNQKNQQEQDNYNRIFDAVSKSLADDTATIKTGFTDIKNALSTTQFKVKVEAGLPVINAVRI